MKRSLFLGKRQKATIFGCALSTVVHAALVVMLSLDTGHARGIEQAAGAQAVFLVDEPESPSPAKAAAPAAGPAKQPGVARKMRKLPRALTAVAAADPDVDQDNDVAEKPTTVAPEITMVAAKEEPAPPAKGAVHVTPELARGLRVYDNFPAMPSDANAGARPVQVEVCVSDRGAVSDAVITQRTVPKFDDRIRAAILTWRYRPFLVNGTPIPFCHAMRISYAMN